MKVSRSTWVLTWIEIIASQVAYIPDREQKGVALGKGFLLYFGVESEWSKHEMEAIFLNSLILPIKWESNF